jgi:hypothetical protein
LQFVTDVALLMPAIGTWFLVCSNPKLLTDVSIMKLDWQPQYRSARQVWNFPLQSLTLIWAVANNTQVTGVSLQVWYVACTFACCSDKTELPLICSFRGYLLLWIKVWCHFSQILHPRDWQSLIVCLLLKQLMHSSLFFTILYFLSFDNCLNVLHCDTVCEPLQTSHVSLTLT